MFYVSCSEKGGDQNNFGAPFCSKKAIFVKDMSNVLNITPQTKLSDIVAAKPSLLSVLERLNIKLGFGDASVLDICNQYGFSLPLFTNICAIYSGKRVDLQEPLGKEDLLHLIDYLQTSHKYYSKQLLPAIHNKIHQLAKNGDASNSRIINKFYDDYDIELANHFNFEENIVFPYTRQLLENGSSRAFGKGVKIEQFEQNHTNIEEKLADLKNILLKYLPPEYSNAIRFKLLSDISLLETDLLHHTAIEDMLLVPSLTILKNNGVKPSSLANYKRNTKHQNQQEEQLSQREKEILAAVAQGKTNKEIAGQFNLSVFTVTTHRKNISKKTGINSISGLTVYAIINKLIEINSLQNS